MGFIIAFIQSLVYQYWTIRIEKKYNFFSDPSTKAHAIHNTPTPRVGGIGIFLAFAISTMILMPHYWWLVVSGAVIFGFGLFEDWHGDTSKQYRLGAMALGTLIAIYFGGYVADNSEFFILPYWLAVLFTIFAVVGLSSAINFIDGLNGLAGGVSMVTLSFFAFVDYLYEGSVTLPLSMILGGAILGFFLWNYPKGKIFLGDGGAYFLGFMLAMFSIMLAARHPEVSLWYPLVALSYPIIETFVTISRRIKRKKKYGIAFFEAEKVHYHTLKYRRSNKSNSAISGRILVFHFFINLAAFFVHQYVFALMALVTIVYIVYMSKYKRIIRFQKSQSIFFYTKRNTNYERAS
ncbi:MAG: MraY family glycosyltransferase [Campylobacterales bacterium]|nr:MraY family glycosyltransferase [Campylobacterales bacterium]